MKINDTASLEKKPGHTVLDTSTVLLVKDFYQRDDISRQAPGKRDTIVVRSNEKKQTMQKRHFSMNVSEAYAIFREEHSEESVGKSKFACLRPPHVLLSSLMPRNICTCQQHQNLILILVALHKFDSVFPLYSHEFPVGITCNGANDICWNNMCSKCKNAACYCVYCRIMVSRFMFIRCDCLR